jgi:hypothetical protein
MVRRGVIDEQGRLLLLKGKTPPGETPESVPPPKEPASD